MAQQPEATEVGGVVEHAAILADAAPRFQSRIRPLDGRASQGAAATRSAA
jgi:hypothetical protein